MNYITKKRLKEVIAKVEEKVNFRCKIHPEREDCDGCDEKPKCKSKKITWNCDHSLDLFAESVEELKCTTKEIIGATQFILSNGGYCDCEIIWNAKMHINKNKPNPPPKRIKSSKLRKNPKKPPLVT